MIKYLLVITAIVAVGMWYGMYLFDNMVADSTCNTFDRAQCILEYSDGN